MRYTPECRDAVMIAAALADSVNAPLTLLRTVDSDAMQNTIDDLIQLRAWVPRELVAQRVVWWSAAAAQLSRPAERNQEVHGGRS